MPPFSSATDLHLCVSTLLADPFSFGGEQLDEVVAASAGAGYRGISLWTLHHLMAGRPGSEIKAGLEAAGLSVTCVEGIVGWANAASADDARRDAEPTLEICASYGAPNVGAVLMDAELADPAQAVENLAAIADLAAEIDCAIAIEFLPWTGLPDIGTTWDLIERAGRDNVGFMLDSWHWHRQPGGPGGANAELLASIPGEAIKIFQICDAAAAPVGDDPMAECMSARPLPGDGVVDHAALFALLDQIGAQPAVCPEVFNTGLMAQGPAAAAAAIAEASRRVLAV